ncbi:MAG: TonB-dependent receptor [Longimicrobiaceae bacterium]
MHYLRAGGGIALLLLLFLACPLAAQEPVPPDTIPRDTIPRQPVPGDTIPRDTVQIAIPPEQLPADTFTVRPPEEPQDTLLPAPNLPRFPRPAPTGWAEATWVWDREELNRFHGLSLLELLERVPGLVVTRGGGIGRPAALSAFGLGGGRLRVFLDGYELDPLAAATLDLQEFALVDLAGLRVERGLNEVRIEILTFQLPDNRPYSQIEAATGDYQTRFLRGMFSRPLGQRSTLFLGFDLVDTEGLFRSQPFTTSTGVLRWNYLVTPTIGVEAEYRQTGITREIRGAARVAEDFGRRDLILRGRANPLPGLAVDALLGRSWQQPGSGTSTVEVPRLEVNQAAARATYDAGPAWLTGAARLRSGGTGYPAPELDLAVRAGLRPLPWLQASGQVRQASSGGEGGIELEGTARLGPIGGLSFFGTVATGRRGLGLVRDSIFPTELDPVTGEEGMDTLLVFPTFTSALNGVRLGGEFSRWGMNLGAAFLALDTDLIVPFGLSFDREIDPYVGEVATGVETFFSLPTFYRPLRVEGAYTRWLDVGGWPYLPQEQWRGGLSFHGLFYTGNLEPTIRAEVVHRGPAIVPTPGGEAFAAVSNPYTLVNFYMQIRVLDVRAFISWENILHQQVADVPGRLLTGQRALYGVRWFFFN